MQVDRTNFKDTLPSILHHIQCSDFVSFDCEFTGLITQLQKIEGLFSNHIEFYERIKETAFNFRIIQLGLTAYVFNDGVYCPHVYNLYISPSTFTPNFNNVMVCEVESMEFLAKNKLDFNRVLCQGIKSRRLYSHDQCEQHHYNEFPVCSAENMFLSPEEKALAVSIEDQAVKEVMGNYKLERIVDFKNRTLFAYFRHKYEDMLFDKSRKNMKQFQYAIRFRPKPDIKEIPEHTSTQPNKKMQQQLQKTEKTQSAGKAESKEKTEKACEDEVTEEPVIEEVEQEQPQITKIFETLILGKKPIVGHFPNLDIGLIYQTFLADLPETYDQFCYNLNQMFPFFFDTKVISRRIQSSLKGLKVDLGSLFRACSNPKLLQPYSNFSIAGLEEYVEKQHEAGYDAFITGCAFIGMANYLAGSKGRVQFKVLEAENMLLYSRFSGQVSLSGNRYCSNAVNYDNMIIIQPCTKAEQPKWKEIGQELSRYGSLTVHEDHGQLYYVYEQPRNIEGIIEMYPNWKFLNYSQRRLIRARNMYKEINNVML